jgi:hypothetical protein
VNDTFNANIFSFNKIILIMKWNNLKYNNHKIMKTNLIICERFIGYFSVNKSFLENILIRDLMEIAEAHNPCISCDNHVD